MPGWPDARQTERRLGPRTRDSQFASLAGALSWAQSNTDRRVTDGPADGTFRSRAGSNVCPGACAQWQM